MSYDIYLKDPVTKEVVEVDTPHFIAGGTYAIGGTKELWLNVTYNLGDDVNPDYWKSTEGNAKRALLQLLAMAKIRPDGIWDGD